MSENWTPTDDAALSAAFREFEESGGEIFDGDDEAETADIIAEQIGGTVLMSMTDYTTLTRANHSLNEQALMFRRAMERARADAAKWKKSARFFEVMAWTALVALGVTFAALVAK